MLVYSFIARGAGIILAQYASQGGNFATVAIECMQNITEDNQRFVYPQEGYQFYFLSREGYVFLVVSNDQNKLVAQGFLDKISEQFLRDYGERAHHAIAYSLDNKLGPQLRNQLDYCNSNPFEFNKMEKLKQEVNDVKLVMVENINSVINRGERLESVALRADALEFEANRFRNQGRRIQTHMWWQNFKIRFIVGACIAAVLFIIIIIVMSKIGKSKNSRHNRDFV